MRDDRSTARPLSWWRRVNVEIWIFVLALFLTIPSLGHRLFHTRGEPREAIVAQDILRSGNWILVHGYGDAIPSKPPLFHWIVAAASLPDGVVSEFTTRLPSALAGIILLYFFVRFIRFQVDSSHAWLTGIILLTSVEFMRAATTARVDMLFAALQCGALLALFQWNEIKRSGFPIVAILLMAGAVLTKGPAGVVLPTVVLGLMLVAHSESFLRAMRIMLFIAVPTLMLSGIWYWLAFWQAGEALLKIVYDENIARITGDMEYSAHNHSALRLYFMTWIGLLPWSLFLLAPIAVGLRYYRATWLALRARLSIGWFRSLPPWRQWSLLSCVVFLIFFAIPASKRSVYLLPIFPFLADWLAFVVAKDSVRHFAVWGVLQKIVTSIVVAVLILLLVILYLSPEQLRGMPATLQYIRIALDSLALWLIIAALGCIAAMSCIAWGSQSITSFCIASILLVNIAVRPMAGNELSELKVAQDFEITSTNPPELFSFQFEFYGTAFYANRRIFRLEDHSPKAGMKVLLFEYSLVDLNSMLNKLNMHAEILATGRSDVIRIGRGVVLVEIRGDDLPSAV